MLIQIQSNTGGWATHLQKTYARQIRSSFQVEEKQVKQLFKTPAEIPLETLMD